MSVHTPEQRVPLLKQLQLPLWQVVPPPHRMPQPPQFALSVCSLTQALPQATCPGLHPDVQLPFEHS